VEKKGVGGAGGLLFSEKKPGGPLEKVKNHVPRGREKTHCSLWAKEPNWKAQGRRQGAKKKTKGGKRPKWGTKRNQLGVN